ncbi:MAG TPA: hypothetical protein IAA64_05985 [Candidatus Ornithocaccomicrobium faecavium]|uniref:Uncharacterized protein n=1 Tax=Candidatus Ornithocaccomicrobium faecavium TaxID=2840890 RepID=A0A9D1P6G1_9FIRM|nr:hypothetical protein [Candidatus Ornithocaccomicrobium faecavium]
MAEFTKVMRWFKKMHERNRLLPDCGDCALGNGPISKCRKMLQEHPEECARVIEQYAAEHLEPRYPTRREWQQANFPDAADGVHPCAFMSMLDADCIGFPVCNPCRDRPIPADIAEKLGIKPKE